MLVLFLLFCFGFLDIKIGMWWGRHSLREDNRELVFSKARKSLSVFIIGARGDFRDFWADLIPEETSMQ